MNRKPHTTSRRVAIAVALVVLAVAAAVGAARWGTPTSHSASGHGWPRADNRGAVARTG